MIKVLLVFPKAGFDFLDPPLGLNYLKAALDNSKLNVETKIIDLNKNGNFQEILSEYNPNILGVSVTKPLTIQARNIAGIARAFNKTMIIVAGGPQPTIDPEEFLDHFDIVVRGEGEQTLVNLVASIETFSWENVDGISYRKNGLIQHNPSRELAANLDLINFPNIDNLNQYPDFQFEQSQMAPMITSRGCPYSCIFCTKEIFGKKIRFRTPANIISEMKHISLASGIRTFQFRDDTFTFRRERVMEFCNRLINEGLQFTWLCNTRADLVDKPLIGSMYDAGCRRISFGAESGDQNLLKILKKNVSVDQIINATNWAHEAGMKVKYFLMIGIPGQTEDSVQKTKKLIQAGKPDEMYCSIFLPFPGTYAWEHKDVMGIKFLFNPNDVSEWEKIYYQSNLSFEEALPPIETSVMSSDDIIRFRKEIFYTFYESKNNI